jgi:hypothetical protein
MTRAAHHNRSLNDVKWDGRGRACGTDPAWHGTGAASVAQVHQKEQSVVEAHP